MKDEALGGLLEAFTEYFWSVPVDFAAETIAQWHPEVTAKQFGRVLSRCNESVFWHHCCTVEDGLKEPELAAEHLIFVDESDLNQFLAVRMDGPCCDFNEDDLLHYKANTKNLPEARAIIDFAKAELGVDDGWATQLLYDCIFAQPDALCKGDSWVMHVLGSERYGKIQFRTIEQVERFRELGNRLYQVLPNPVFRGWKPAEVENAPPLPDDIPASAEEIPDGRAAVEQLRDTFDKLLKSNPSAGRGLVPPALKRKVGRNESCPCGSGKKYKKCCGRRSM